MAADGDERQGPEAGVTLAVARRPKPGKEAALEAWIHGVVEEAAAFDGHQGGSVVRPGPGRPEYLILLRFATAGALEAWRRSKSCRAWVAKADEITEGPAHVRELRGLEAWLEGGSPTAPPRWKMAILTWIALYPLLLGVVVALSPVVSDWPISLQLLVTTVILVPLMSYVLVPAMTRVARPWLHR